jgi:hypothetical protein
MISKVNSTDKTFALRGLTVSYAGTVSYLNGTEADLVEGAKVEIKGTLAPDLSHIDASLVMFEH